MALYLCILLYDTGHHFAELATWLMYSCPFLRCVPTVLTGTVYASIMKRNPSPTRSKYKRQKPKCARYYARTRHREKVYRKRTKLRMVPHEIAAMYTDKEGEQTRPTHCDSDSYDIGIDNHATSCMTPDKSDFIDKPKQVTVRVKGIAGKLAAAYKGTVMWQIQDDQGGVHKMRIPNAYYVPSLPLRLLSPQHLAQVMRKYEKTEDGTCCHTYHNRVVLKWQDQSYTKTVTLGRANVATMRSAPGFSTYQAFATRCDVTDSDIKAYDAHWIPPDEGETDHEMETEGGPSAQSDIQDRSNAESEETVADPVDVTHTYDLSDIKNDANIIDPDDDARLDKATTPVQELLVWHYRLGHLSFRRLQDMARQHLLPARIATCRPPECAACRFCKATKVPWRGKGQNDKRSKLRQVTKPGQCVSVDQMESSAPGLIAQLKGRPTKSRYKYATVFVDHYSDLSFVFLQKSITSAETLRAKLAFEAFADRHGVRIVHYHADNGRFADNAFLGSVANKKQSILFCGVNAHFQNGRAEKRIRDLQDQGRTQLLHAKHRWPSMIDAALWPYALRTANHVHNNAAREGGQPSPLEMFSQSDIPPKLKYFHPFGCPVYVLDNRLQSGNSLPKWAERARVGVYLGPSPRHARSVSLVLNPETGLVSPQFHVRHDNLFETVRRQPSISPKWRHKCHFDTAPDNSTMNEGGITNQQAVTDNDTVNDRHGSGTTSEPDEPIQVPGNTEAHDENEVAAEEENPNAGENATNDPEQQTTTRSGRVVRKPQYHQDYVAFEALQEDDYREIDVTEELDEPLIAFKASNDPDTMYYDQAMREPDAQSFKEAMVKEVQDHTNRKHWKVIRRNQVPADEIILPAVWAMKRKRKITTREVYKWKSRLNLGGHKMIPGKHYDQTYAPALAWSTIRLFLTLVLMHGWHTRQIDFVLAYPQAKVPRPTYMELPRGINFPNGINKKTHCLHVLQNIYGGKDAGRTWYLYLRNKLTNELGFEQSKIDECVFYRGTTIILIYTDDCIVIDKESAKNIDMCIMELKKHFNVEDEGSLEDYLGVRVTQHEDGSIKLEQPHLIDSILIDLGLLDENGMEKPNVSVKHTPALTTRIIGPDRDGAPFDYPWDYRSVIGKLNFLEKSTRPDLAQSVHQCARFMSEPKKSHGEAVKHIGRYLLKTRGKGMTMRPDEEKQFECMVDADYCGNWDRNIAMNDPATAKSRHGFIVKYAGVPLYWASKMQTQIALSTAESEYIGLSTAARYVKGIIYLMEEINAKVVVVPTTPVFRCTMFEDNNAALEMARVPKMRPRTRHLNVALHHFRSEVANGRIKVMAIDTKMQEADILTKSTDQSTLERHRLKLLGW